MKLEFNWKFKDYELRAVPKALVRLDDIEPNQTIELLKWENGRKNCYTLAYWKHNRDGYVLTFIGNRPFDDIRDEDFSTIWAQMKIAQKLLNNYHEHLEDSKM